MYDASGVRGYDLEVLSMITKVLGTGNVNVNTPIAYVIQYLPVPRDSILSYVIWLMSHVPELLDNDATLARVTNLVSVDIREIHV